MSEQLNDKQEVFDVDDTKSQKKVSNRHKRLNYAEDKKAVSDRILEVIGITDTHKTFYSHLLDENKDAQAEILKLDNEIKRIFPISTWNAYKPGSDKMDRRYLSIVKSILKATDVKYNSASLKMNYKGSTINTTLYTIE
jgi:hypothetical protein